MDTFKLKIFAIIVMLIDHIGAIFISPYTNYWLNFAFRGIGRLAFPIFVFLIVEGFYHTSNITKYLQRLGLFALISEIPFDLAFYKFHYGANFVSDIKFMFSDLSNFALMLNKFGEHQNVFFTLFLGLALITLMDMVEKKFYKNTMINLLISNILDAVLTIVFCFMAYYLKTDYGIAGILMIVAFYLFRQSKALITLSLLVISVTMLSDFSNFVITNNYFKIVGLLAVLAIIPIGLYNGKKGKNIKYFFYIFYPAHMFCLFLIVSFL